MGVGRVALLGVAGSMIAFSAIANDAPAQSAQGWTAAEPQFEWGRPYFGVSGGGWYDLGVGWEFIRANFIVGRNFQLGPFVAGIEATAGVYWPTPTFEAYLMARAGLLAGHRLLIYAVAGVGWDFGCCAIVAGGGVEAALGNQVSLRVEALAYAYGLPFDYFGLTAGLNFFIGD